MYRSTCHHHLGTRRFHCTSEVVLFLNPVKQTKVISTIRTNNVFIMLTILTTLLITQSICSPCAVLLSEIKLGKVYLGLLGLVCGFPTPGNLFLCLNETS